MLSRIVFVLTCVATSLVFVVASPAEESSKKSLPRLGNAGAVEDVTGTIADSTRGREGPVRLVLSISGGRELAALVTLDEVCEALGLSLRKGEEVTLRGQTVTTGERPLFVTEAVIVDGAPVPVRDPSGGWAKVGPTAEARARAKEAEAAGGGTNSEKAP